MTKVIDGEFFETTGTSDEPPLLAKLRIYAFQHNNIHLSCDVFTKQVCTCRYEDGGLVPDKWTDENILAGLNQQLSHHFMPNKHPYAKYTFANTLGLTEVPRSEVE